MSASSGKAPSLTTYVAPNAPGIRVVNKYFFLVKIDHFFSSIHSVHMFAPNAPDKRVVHKSLLLCVYIGFFCHLFCCCVNGSLFAMYTLTPFVALNAPDMCPVNTSLLYVSIFCRSLLQISFVGLSVPRIHSLHLSLRMLPIYVSSIRLFCMPSCVFHLVSLVDLVCRSLL